MKKLIILIGFVFVASCASYGGSGGSMGYADLQSGYGSPYINDSPSNPLGSGLRGFGD